MTENEFKKEISLIYRQLFNGKEKNKEQWDCLEKQTQNIVCDAPSKFLSDALILLAKVQYHRFNFKDSENTYSLLKKDIKKRKTALVGELKCKIMLNKFQEALEVIDSLEDYFKNIKKTNCDFNLFRVVLKYLLGEDVELPINENIYMSSIIKDEKLLKYYKRLIELVKNKNFGEAIIQTQKCNEISVVKNEYCEFLTLKHLISEANQRKLEKIENIIDILNEKVFYQKYEEVYEIIISILFNNKELKDVLKYINILIENGYANLLKSLKDNKNYVKKENVLFKYITKAIDEQNFFEKLSGLDQEKFKNILYCIQENLLKKDYVNAFYEAQCGIYLFNSPIFVFYMGVASYYNENYEMALKYLSKYMVIGSIKLREAYMYLLKCYKKLKLPKENIPGNKLYKLVVQNI